MKKYINIAFTALLALTMFSCTKKADVAAIEPKLPKLQLSSLGYQQAGPFTFTNVAASGTTPAVVATILQLSFGATATNTKTGQFTVEIIDGATISDKPTITKTVTFPSWASTDATSTATVTNHTITYALQPTTYPNTNVYAGIINLKLNLLSLAANKTYSVRATAYNSDGSIKSVFSQLAFFKTGAQ